VRGKIVLGKKAISPLVATVLLIAFSVALGAVVMSWGENYIKDRAQFVSGKSEISGPCENVAVSPIIAQGRPQACMRGSAIELLIENGNTRLEGLKVRVVGSEGIDIKENVLQQPLEPKGSAKVIITHTAGVVTQLKLTPMIIAANQQQYCTESETVVEDLLPCAG